ncbi:MAG: hypothetical protein P4L40_14010 [Terracidiphilus sp.]|nr:hypothetical protein [Terracidiphilus sp.]
MCFLLNVQVMVEHWARANSIGIGHYQRSFAALHDLHTLAEVRKTHAFLAKVCAWGID